jgi:hypothetical protein
MAAGNLNFVEKVKSEFGFKAAHRELIPARFQLEPVGIQNRKSKMIGVKPTGAILPVKMRR